MKWIICYRNMHQIREKDRLSNDWMAASSYQTATGFFVISNPSPASVVIDLSMGHGRQREGRRTSCPRGFFNGFTSLNQLPKG